MSDFFSHCFLNILHESFPPNTIPRNLTAVLINPLMYEGFSSAAHIETQTAQKIKVGFKVLTSLRTNFLKPFKVDFFIIAS